MTTYQTQATMTGAIEAVKLCVFQMEMKKYDARNTIPEILEMGGPLDAPDSIPAGFLENNDGDALVVTTERPGRYSTKQEAEYDEFLAELGL
mgnify:CR=1 FL=1